MSRNARLQNEELYKKRERLRKEVREIQKKFYDLEGEYWHKYHKRLADISTAHSNGPASNWISAFGENEKQVLDTLVKDQDKLREKARLKQEELANVDREFWDAWRKHVDFMRGLTSVPPSSGSTPAAPPQPADNQASSPLSSIHNKDETSQGGSTTPSSAVGVFLQEPAVGESAQSASASVDRTPPFELRPRKNPRFARKPGRRTRGSAAGEEQGADSKTRSGAPSPKSLTPKGAFSGSENQGESSQEPADDSQPARAHKAAAAASRSVRTSAAVKPAKPSPLALPKLITPHNQGDGFIGVTDPVVGEIYQGFYKDDECSGWWFCTLLPWDAWERDIGIRSSLHEANMFTDLPECYTTEQVRASAKSRKMKNVIKGWKKGFEDGGSRVRERVFPVLFFDDNPGAPGNFNFPKSPEKVFNFSKKALNGLPAEWVAAADLRLPGAVVDGDPAGGRDTAGRFRDRFQARRDLLDQKKSRTHNKRAKIGSSSAVEANSPSAVEASSPVEGGRTREDTEMADAESLSGATAVDEASVQPETPKNPSAAKTSSSGPDKGWRAVIFGVGS